MYYVPTDIHIYGTQSAQNATQSMPNGTHSVPADTQSVLQVSPLTKVCSKLLLSVLQAANVMKIIGNPWTSMMFYWKLNIFIEFHRLSIHFFTFCKGIPLVCCKEFHWRSKRLDEIHWNFNRKSSDFIDVPRCSLHFARGTPCKMSRKWLEINAIQWCSTKISMEFFEFHRISMNFSTFCKGYPL